MTTSFRGAGIQMARAERMHDAKGQLFWYAWKRDELKTLSRADRELAKVEWDSGYEFGLTEDSPTFLHLQPDEVRLLFDHAIERLRSKRMKIHDYNAKLGLALVTGDDNSGWRYEQINYLTAPLETSTPMILLRQGHFIANICVQGSVFMGRRIVMFPEDWALLAGTTRREAGREIQHDRQWR